MRKATIVEYYQKYGTRSLHKALATAADAKNEQLVAREELSKESRKRKQVAEQQQRRLAARITLIPEYGSIDADKYLSVATEEEVKTCYRKFYEATSTEALKISICGVCAREDLDDVLKLTNILLNKIPNSIQLRPLHKHHGHCLIDGLLLEPAGVIEQNNQTHVGICRECLSDLQKFKENPPKFSLANGLWIGNQPMELQKLNFPEQLLISLVYPRVYVFKLFPKMESRGFDTQSLQRGMRGTISSYELDMEGVASMVQGQLLPRHPAILAELITVTFIGRGKIPKRYLRQVFRVRRSVILDALKWLKVNNKKYFGNITISEENLKELPEDDVPEEITSTMRQYEDEGILAQEDNNYVHQECDSYEHPNTDLTGVESEDTESDEEPDVRLDISGTSDVDMSKLSVKDLTKSGLSNLFKERYEIRHGTMPISDYPHCNRQQNEMRDIECIENYWEKAFPFLFPYGVGGFEGPHKTRIELREHVRWAMQYHGKQFRKHETFPFVSFGILQRREALASAKVQIHSRSYEKNKELINSVTLEKLLQAETIEVNGGGTVDSGVQYLKNEVKLAAGRVMGSDHSRIRLRSQIWSTTLILGPPTIWLTINPSDTHDPVAQLFVGNKIDMNNFMPTLGPTSSERAHAIAADPYAAAKFFHFIINTFFETLLGVKVMQHCVRSVPGIFGQVNAYFGTVESQGRGTLHLHTLIWLKNTPSSEDIHKMLAMSSFRKKVCQYIKENFRAYLPGLESKEKITSIPEQKEIAYSRPINPNDLEYVTKIQEFELKLARMEQIHTCQPRRCLIQDWHGHLKCKRRAPFLCSDEDFITEKGHWGPKRLYGYVNTWVPGILLNMRCNNDGKLLTSGEETKNITYYVTSYAAKKQGRNFNLSAVLAKGFAYHADRLRHSYVEQLKDTQKLLLFRLLNAINREQELAAPMVVSYLMGWGDVKQSHTYTAIYWTGFKSCLVKMYPQLRDNGQGDLSEPTQSHSEGDKDDENVSRWSNERRKSFIERIQALSNVATLIRTSEGKILCASQVTDYQFRGRDLEDYNVLDFFINTYEEDINKTSKIARIKPSDGPDVTDENESRHCGRPRNTRVYYSEDHPKHKDKCRVHRTRGHRNLPNIVGSQLPRNDDPTIYNLYCASALLLLKPWREIHELKAETQTWPEAFQSWLGMSPDASRWHFILSGIQYYHECLQATKESKENENIIYDDHSMTREVNEINDTMDSGEARDEYSTSADNGLTEEGLKKLIENAIPLREKLHALHAIESAKRAKIFDADLEEMRWTPTDVNSVSKATGDDFVILQKWKGQMLENVQTQNNEMETSGEDDYRVQRSIQIKYALPSVQQENKLASGGTAYRELNFSVEEPLLPVHQTSLNAEQQRAYQIIIRHLDETLANAEPPTLRMIIYGEGGTGKSKLIQTVTEAFIERGLGSWLVKAAYTGVAASLIGGKTTHTLASIGHGVNSNVTEAMKKKLQQFWKQKRYLILDEYSMLGKTFLRKLSRNIAIGKIRSDSVRPDDCFGGVNVILCGDLHQFPPVAQSQRECLFKPLDIGEDREDQLLGRQFYEAFQTVVILTEQMRVHDPVWRDFLTHLRYGRVQEKHTKMLKELIIGNRTDETSYSTPPWSDSSLVTPRQAVRHEWNRLALRKHCIKTGVMLLICSAEDKIGERDLTLAERYALEQKNGNDKHNKLKEVPREVEIAVGMKVLITNNLETDLDITNGAKGTIVRIILHPDESVTTEASAEHALKHQPICVLVKLERTRASRLIGLEDGVIPIEPTTVNIQIRLQNEKGKVVQRTIKRKQLPITAAYGFTDYRAQGQTIKPVIVDIASPPSGKLSLFNLYVALSRSPGRDAIRLLRPFEDSLFLGRHDNDLLTEDDRLAVLNEKTKTVFKAGTGDMNHLDE